MSAAIAMLVSKSMLPCCHVAMYEEDSRVRKVSIDIYTPWVRSMAVAVVPCFPLFLVHIYTSVG